jgi:diaminohydroxyphosphoribosylaminopyrimidine deaminase/5-amino-6-(5-phosphoribosylamino)uracil reductase
MSNAFDDQIAALRRVWPSLLGMAHGSDSHDSPETDDCPLWPLYAPIAAGHRDDPARPFVIGQLGQSLDGRIATSTGKSRYIGCPQAIGHLHRLRALVDAVVVGVETVIADDPQLNVREAEGPSPVRVVIDPNFRLPPQARMLGDGGRPIYAIQADDRMREQHVEPVAVAQFEGKFHPADIVQALAARGFRRILVEGGAATGSAFLSAGVLDRFHLAIAPMVIGSGPIGINLPPIDELDEALRPVTTTYQLGRDVLFDCAFR